MQIHQPRVPFFLAANEFSEEASHMNEVVVSLIYSNLLICVGQEVLYFISSTSDACGGYNWPEI